MYSKITTVAFILLALVMTGFIHFDHTGISIGSDTSYCSVETTGISCQNGQ